MAAARHSDSTLTQPKTYTISLRAVASLPSRLWRPPPSTCCSGKSYGLIPVLNVRLEDVLNRKHLPPLGLKDFEEWLLFVEMGPENLYFVLWLKEYKLRYQQWKSQTAFEQNHIPGYPVQWAPQHSSQLAMFYARAKQTFLTPNADYELNVPSSLLAPFHRPNAAPHPDPDMFDEIAIEANRMLNESLKRFVHAQLSNVGNKRALCGVVAGIVFILFGVVPPLAVNFVRGGSRWLRMTAFPGAWMGLTVIIAALSGLCVGVYAFGDFRQLRKFELARPPISSPQPMPAFKPRTRTGSGESTERDGTKSSVQNGIASSVGTLTRVGSASSSGTRSSQSHCEPTESSDCGIQISPAYFDAGHADGPIILDDEEENTNPVMDPRYGIGSPTDSHFTSTASFIHPFDTIDDDDAEFERALDLPERHQRMTPFRFDALPKRYNHRKSSYAETKTTSVPDTGFRDPTTPHILNIPKPIHKSWIGRFQDRVVRSKYTPHHVALPNPAAATPIAFDSYPSPYHCDVPSSIPSTPLCTSTTVGPFYDHYRNTTPDAADHVDPEMHRSRIKEETASLDKQREIQKRNKLVKAVPAFDVPLARVLNPLVVRGQWEIVVRSAALATLLSILFIVVIVSLPVPGK